MENMEMNTEKKIVHSFTVVEYDDGNFDVEDAGREGTVALEKEEIYQAIILLADLIDKTRTANLVRVNTYRAMQQFFSEMMAAQQGEGATPETPEKPEVTL